MIDHPVMMIVQVMIHTDFQKRKKSETDFTHNLPTALINDFFNLCKILFYGLPVFQFKHRQVDVIFRIKEISQRRINLDLIIIPAQGIRSTQGLYAKCNRHHKQR